MVCYLFKIISLVFLLCNFSHATELSESDLMFEDATQAVKDGRYRRRCAGCSPRVTTPCAEPVCRAGSYTSASTTRTPSSRVPSFSRSACNCAPGELLTADCSRKASTVLTALPRAGQQPADELPRAQHTLPYKAAPAEHCPPLPAHLHDHVGSNTVRCM